MAGTQFFEERVVDIRVAWAVGARAVARCDVATSSFAEIAASSARSEVRLAAGRLLLLDPAPCLGAERHSLA